MTEMQNVKCPDCSSNSLKLIGKLPDSNRFSGKMLDHLLNGGNLYQCTSCLLKFRFPIFSQEEYAKLYNNEELNWIYEETRNDWKLLERFISSKVPDGGKILDFGCNLGDVLVRLPNKFEKFGIEINKSSAERAAQTSGATIWSNWGEIPTNMKFDLIYAIDVAEHLPSPSELVLKALTFLEQGGFLVLLSGDSNNFFWNLSKSKWWYCVLPEHIAFISKSWAQAIEKSFDDIEMVQAENYRRNENTWTKKMKWFVVWAMMLALPKFGRRVLNLSEKVKRTGMADSKHFGRHFSADHLFVVFKKQ